MKPLGVIKKVDELGRIVIPKDMRRVLNISDGEVLEVFVSNDDIILKKYDSFSNNVVKIRKIFSIIEDLGISKCLLVDKEKIILSGDDEIIFNKEFCKLIINRVEYEESESLFGKLFPGKYFFFVPIITEIDCNAGVLLVFDEEIKEVHRKIGRLVGRLLININ